jgi:hypothetical protein
MGVGRLDLHSFIWLKQLGYIPDGSSVVEIGAQQLGDSFLTALPDLEKIAGQFSVKSAFPLRPRGDKENPLDLLDGAPFAAGFWEWLGLKYVSIDFDGTASAIALDLNFDEIPARMAGKFQLVTNLGTTEHVANQLQAFKVIHDLCAVGGVMMHNVPAQGYVNHGLVNYNPKFFWLLARSNGYRVLHMTMSTDDIRPLPDDLVEYCSAFDGNFVDRMKSIALPTTGLLAIFVKSYDIAYVPPIDVRTGVKAPNEVLEARYWSTFDPNAFVRFERARAVRFSRRLRAWAGRNSPSWLIAAKRRLIR